MTDLLDELVEAHGGLKRWDELQTVTALPAGHRIYGRTPDGRAPMDQLLVAIDISEIEFA